MTIAMVVETTAGATMPILDLNGPWMLDGRTVAVPGLHLPAGTASAAAACYRRRVDLPAGDWSHATLELDGARFRPAVRIDGSPVAQSEGGMGRLRLPLAHAGLRPGTGIELAVELTGLAALPRDEASRIPPADLWRSNNAACLWDGVRLRLHGPVVIARVVPWHRPEAGIVELAVELEHPSQAGGDLRLEAELVGPDGAVLARTVGAPGARLALDAATAPWWSPESPACCRLRVRAVVRGAVSDEREQTWGRRDFRIVDRRFHLNGRRRCLRSASVVWHRWIRSDEGRALAWDMDWVETHLLRPLKAHGVDLLRFHLGMPPRAWLDACDRLGLMVQAEWHFFHGLDAGHDSMVHQWGGWLRDCLEHPAVVLHHPWNETDGDVLAAGFAALDRAVAGLPPLVLAHRDVCHVHKYWWSLFENPSCAHDSWADFGQVIMVDEFGGNYLDGDGVPGGYSTLSDAFSRFLGRGHTREQRLRLQAEANGRVAEYWRRLGAGGFSTFCTLGSWEDGNHHYLGRLRDGVRKPVWTACAAAWAPVSVSLDLWDRGFRPGQAATVPLHRFNELEHAHRGRVALRVRPGWSADGGLHDAAPAWEQIIGIDLPPGGGEPVPAVFRMPDAAGPWTMEAELLDAPGCAVPVRSTWRVRTVAPAAPARLAGAALWIPAGDEELHGFAAAHGLRTVADPGAADLLVTGRAARAGLADPTSPLHAALAAALARGAAVACLDLGPRWLGQGYPEKPGEHGHLQAGPVIGEPREELLALPGGLRVRFREVPEPESCCHPVRPWPGLDAEAACFWNGLRGGLVAPAAEMAVAGLAPRALHAQWLARGATAAQLAGGRCTAYELCGQWLVVETPDPAHIGRLRERIRFLAEDAPALAPSLNPGGTVQTIDVAAELAAADPAGAVACTPRAECGRQLRRTPLLRCDLAGGGRILLSQLLTDGRLHGSAQALARAPHDRVGGYALRADPTAQAIVLAELDALLGPA